VSVMAVPEGGPAVLAITWPGGRRTSTPIPANAREMTVNALGELKVSR
jgi:hypothetical protein